MRWSEWKVGRALRADGVWLGVWGEALCGLEGVEAVGEGMV
jgi:hypothetical protein